MLQWIWFVVLMLIGTVIIFRSASQEDELRYMFLGCSIQLMGFVFVADRVFVPAYNWLSNILPGNGTALNLLTTIALMVVIFFGGIILLDAVITSFAGKMVARNDRT